MLSIEACQVKDIEREGNQKAAELAEMNKNIGDLVVCSRGLRCDSA